MKMKIQYLMAISLLINSSVLNSMNTDSDIRLNKELREMEDVNRIILAEAPKLPESSSLSNSSNWNKNCCLIALYCCFLSSIYKIDQDNIKLSNQVRFQNQTINTLNNHLQSLSYCSEKYDEIINEVFLTNENKFRRIENFLKTIGENKLSEEDALACTESFLIFEIEDFTCKNNKLMENGCAEINDFFKKCDDGELNRNLRQRRIAIKNLKEFINNKCGKFNQKNKEKTE